MQIHKYKSFIDYGTFDEEGEVTEIRYNFKYLNIKDTKKLIINVANSNDQEIDETLKSYKYVTRKHFKQIVNTAERRMAAKLNLN